MLSPRWEGAWRICNDQIHRGFEAGGGGDFSGLFAVLAIVFIPLLLCAGLISLITGGSSPRGENAPASVQQLQTDSISEVQQPNNGTPAPGKTVGVQDQNNNPIQIGDGQWVIRFTMPGPRLIKTSFEMPLGQTYYISTREPVPNLQVGWLDDTGKLKLATAPAIEFTKEKPLVLVMESSVKNAKLVFATQLVPDGHYEIRIVKSLVTLERGEYAPGIPAEKNFK